ncbi:uncharacterized protein A1O9_06611 [Exophiala aquamarina CBS 119918]|uniref:J domain-containing protein n=1 Tax=Exophiala aquamarina CBS 119918 TaxID=1182545 RepID=A0A072PT44_9EURO|nr:uncharacterized protein A1O9_06611 [Exophiala aquamarina CBS 119918]KEF58685.1 hypothetical protein A1O9_06611 [Exophiala aquamarina CBS 119918]
MAPSETTEDYYYILEISQSANLISIKSSYKRLAKARHPDKNPTNPSATVEFQLLQEAYSALCDPETRRAYDIRYPSIQRMSQNGDSTTHHVPCQPAKSSDTKSENEIKLERLNTTRLRKEGELFNERRELSQIRRDLRLLQDEEARTEREKASKNGWWAYMASFVSVSTRETPEQRLEKERQQVDRRAAHNIKERIFERQDFKVKSSETILQSINDEIKKVELAIWMQKREEERVRMRQAEMRAAQAAQELRRAEDERIRREYQQSMRAAEMARIRREEQIKRQQEEHVRKEAEARRAMQAAAAAKRMEEDAEMRTRFCRGTSIDSSSFPITSSACNHRDFWAQIEGGHKCSRCKITTTKFAFECPGCAKVACADCRRAIKGQPPRFKVQQRHRKGTFR